jgi:guanylate kinase
MRKNIEFKAYDDDAGRLRKICKALGGRLLRSHEQRDTYFSVRNGRLKLRESDKYGTSLIYYDRPSVTGHKGSNFEIVDIDPGDSCIIKLFTEAVGTFAVVKKRRDSFEIKSALVNVDDVEDLGSFFEVEVDVDDAGGERNALILIEELKTAFSVSPADILPWSYSEMKVMYAASSRWREKLKDAIGSGKMFILDGPSCSGKTTIVEHLLDDESLALRLVPRYCTRKPRGDKSAENEYVFVTEGEFNGLIKTGAFIEYRDFKFGMSYGLPWEESFSLLLGRLNAIGIMNLGNIRHVKKVFPEATTVLIDAPAETIKERLIRRGVNNEEQIEERLENARTVAHYKPYYDHIVVNEENSLEESVSSMKEIISSHVEGAKRRGSGRR